MRSKLFQRREISKGLIEDLTKLAQINSTEVKKIFREYEKLDEKGIVMDEESIVEIIKNTEISAEEAKEAIETSINILIFCDEEKDSIKNIVADLVTRKKIDEELSKTLLLNLNELSELYEKTKIGLTTRKRRTVYRYFHRLRRVDVQCFPIPRFEPKFETSKHKLEGFSTEIKEWFPVCKVNLIYRDHTNTSHSATFTAGEEVLDDLISLLLAAKIELLEIKKQF